MEPAPVLSGVPRIVTDRLILRGLVADDFDAYAIMMADPDVTSIIRPANAASIRVATSLGATPAETVEFYGAPSVLYRYPRLP